MNGIGVGTAVGLGATIGLGILAPNAELVEYFSTFTVYGALSGFIFQIWKMALAGWQPPFFRRR